MQLGCLFISESLLDTLSLALEMLTVLSTHCFGCSQMTRPLSQPLVKSSPWDQPSWPLLLPLRSDVNKRQDTLGGNWKWESHEHLLEDYVSCPSWRDFSFMTTVPIQEVFGPWEPPWAMAMENSTPESSRSPDLSGCLGKEGHTHVPISLFTTKTERTDGWALRLSLGLWWNVVVDVP